jgi:hypothetical protein
LPALQRLAAELFAYVIGYRAAHQRNGSGPVVQAEYYTGDDRYDSCDLDDFSDELNVSVNGGQGLLLWTA